MVFFANQKVENILCFTNLLKLPQIRIFECSFVITFQGNNAIAFFESEDYHLLNIKLYESLRTGEVRNGQDNILGYDDLDKEAKVSVFEHKFTNSNVTDDDDDIKAAYDDASALIFVDRLTEAMSSSEIFDFLRSVQELVDADSFESIIMYIPKEMLPLFLDFRVGDVMPKYHFHFQNIFPNLKYLAGLLGEEYSKYLNHHSEGCLLVLKRLSIFKDDTADDNACYWAPYLNSDENEHPRLSLRKVAPRYYDYRKFFPELTHLLKPENLVKLKSEVENVRYVRIYLILQKFIDIVLTFLWL